MYRSHNGLCLEEEMAQNDVKVASSVVVSLWKSFRRVPPDSIPTVLDCLLDSTALSPHTLFDSLIDSYSEFAEVLTEGQELNSNNYNYLATFLSALCHLLKKFGHDPDALNLFIWRIFLPLVKTLHSFNRELLNQVGESFTTVVVETNGWGVLEANLVPFLLKSVDCSLGRLQNEEIRNNDLQYLTGSLPLPISCHILALMLDVSLSSQNIIPISGSVTPNGCIDSRYFAGDLIWNLCNLTECMLLQSLEHRTCAISFLLPIIFKAFALFQSFEVQVHGETCLFYRNEFFVKVWNCCKTLFSLGLIERRDAYSVLSLYLSLLSCTAERGDSDVMLDNDGLDITNDLEFWDKIREGLIDKESLVRKQSLHMLKMAVHLNRGSRSNGVSEVTPRRKRTKPLGMTKREAWAETEAKSLGVGRICNSIEPALNSQEKWEAFILLFEMLEEYGTHLVEAAWNHQVSLLLESSTMQNHFANSNGGEHRNQLETSSDILSWLAILWERGLHHDNPQVRCLIMQSILGIEWKNYGNFAKSVPETFVLGSFLQSLNDPVHHKEFGIKGVYASETIEGARQFLRAYACCLGLREWLAFLNSLASAPKHHSFSRVGLMGLAECIAAAANRVETDNDEIKTAKDEDPSQHNDKIILLDALRFVIESTKQHFNPNYRLQVCEKMLEAAASVACTFDVPLEVLMHFLSTFRREFTDFAGSLRVHVQNWLSGCGKKHCTANCSSMEFGFLKSLHDFPSKFTSPRNMGSEFSTFGDEDLEAWESEARRWARVLFLATKEESHFVPIWMFIQKEGFDICNQNKNLEHSRVKFLVLTMSLIRELQIMQERATEYGVKFRTRSEISSIETVDKISSIDSATLYRKFANIFVSFMEELVSFANISCLIFSSSINIADNLPGSVKGKLGGPSQRRLSFSTTTAVLKAVASVKTVALLSSWCSKFESGNSLHCAFKFLWKFYWNTISSQACDSETGAEMCLAAYEALSCALKTLASVFSPQTLDYLCDNEEVLRAKLERKPLLDFMILSFVLNINKLVGVGFLVRTRRAVLMNWKWLCLESLLSIPGNAVKNGINLEGNDYFFSDDALRQVFNDLVENLENAGEGSLLPMLRSVRLSLDLFASGKLGSLVSSCSGVEYQMVWNLVRSSWILHASCNKRKVAPIAALLSSILHSSLFADETMHTTDGPLKWFIGKVLEEGTKSPRTIRLAALHLSGLWMSYPNFIKYYIKELKLLSLYGSIAFDEDFEGELAENHDTQVEISLLAKSANPELTEAFINTELYARVSVAVLFHKLADLVENVGAEHDHTKSCAALESGKLFLLDLLDAAVNDKDLAKELYKKYSAIHRRKIRAWQMICVLSRFVCEEIVGKVTDYMHLSLSRNNLPAVRQYLETFAINTYLKFPSLVGEQLVPILRDYDMKPQALASYVFIAANVILHASEAVQSEHLDNLLPPIVPLLTSHHHSLRGFTQLLVYQVLSRFFPPSDSKPNDSVTLEKRCFEDMKTYLAKNTDCARLRASMEGFLDAYNPTLSVTPAGIFINRVEQLEFECVPKSLMEEVLVFLNDVREDLRSSMAKDVVMIKNESLRSNNDQNTSEVSSKDKNGNSLMSQPIDVPFDFQKKITLYKHEKQDNDGTSLSCYNGSYKQLMEIEKEDQLLDHLLRSRSLQMEKFRTSRQQFIMVASLVDRIPNLAGLARTCEVFKASGLTVPDASILQDKQFQLISVTADKWVPISEVPVDSMKVFLEKKKKEGYSILGLEQTANSIPLDKYHFPKKTVLVLGREKEGIPVDIIHILDACVEIPQLGVVRSLNVHVSGAIALWEYTRQQRS